MINKNWNVWIWASMIKHFNAYRENLPLYIEGQDRPKDKQSDFIEFRMDGPYLIQLDKTQYRADIELNILITSCKNDKDDYKSERDIGIVTSMFHPTISIFKVGTPNSDGSLLSCFSLRDDKREKIVVSRFGIIEPTNRIMQATVEGHYTGVLE